MSKPISEWQREIHEWAKGQGFYEEERSLGDQIALMHSELSEALEAYRETGHTRRYFYDDNGEVAPWAVWADVLEDKIKPEGVGPEFADCVIRIMDTCQALGIDLEKEIQDKMEYNRTRPYRHGKVKL